MTVPVRKFYGIRRLAVDMKLRPPIMLNDAEQVLLWRHSAFSSAGMAQDSLNSGFLCFPTADDTDSIFRLF